MPIIVQQDATIYSLFISVNRSTCFEWYLHPSSGTHVTVSTVHRERDWTSRTVTFTTGCSGGFTNAIYCGYSDMSFCRWVEILLEICRAVWKGSHLMTFTVGHCILSDFMWYLSVTETKPPFIIAFEKMLCKERYIACVIYAVITQLGACSTQLRA